MTECKNVLSNIIIKQNSICIIYWASLKTSEFLIVDFVFNKNHRIMIMGDNISWDHGKSKRTRNFLLPVTVPLCTCSVRKTAFSVPLPTVMSENHGILCKTRVLSHVDKKTLSDLVSVMLCCTIDATFNTDWEGARHWHATEQSFCVCSGYEV